MNRGTEEEEPAGVDAVVTGVRLDLAFKPVEPVIPTESVKSLTFAFHTRALLPDGFIGSLIHACAGLFEGEFDMEMKLSETQQAKAQPGRRRGGSVKGWKKKVVDDDSAAAPVSE